MYNIGIFAIYKVIWPMTHKSSHIMTNLEIHPFIQGQPSITKDLIKDCLIPIKFRNISFQSLLE